MAEDTTKKPKNESDDCCEGKDEECCSSGSSHGEACGNCDCGSDKE